MVFPTSFQIHTCTITSKLKTTVQQIAIGTITGTFIVGETIVGGTSVATGKVYAIGTDYLQYQVLTGVFASGEIITGRVSAATTTSTDAPSDALSQGVPITVSKVQSSIPCRFFPTSATKLNLDTGEHYQRLAKVLFPAGTEVYEGDTIVGDDAGFDHTYRALPPTTIYEAAVKTVSHIRVELEAID